MPVATHPKSQEAINQRWMEEIIRVCWMGLGGRTADLSQYLRRLVPKWEKEQPELSRRLGELLQQSSFDAPMTRKASPTPSPAFDFSSLQGTGGPEQNDDLVRVEFPVQLPIEPVWPVNVSEELLAIVAERKSVSQLSQAGLTPTHTVIFTGLPGMGKTLAARWLARELGLPLAVLNLGSVMSSFLGRTGANLREVIAQASRQPCVLLLDEIDSIAKRRDDNSDIGELKRLVTVLLQELDAWPAKGLLIAATNHEQLIDPAVWRRFERRVAFPLPTSNSQAELMARLVSDEWSSLPTKTRISVGVAASRLSPAELTQLGLRSKRESVLKVGRFEDRLLLNLSNAVALLPLAVRKKIAQDLLRLRVGQREMHRITGLARETIRELT